MTKGPLNMGALEDALKSAAIGAITERLEAEKKAAIARIKSSEVAARLAAQVSDTPVKRIVLTLLTEAIRSRGADGVKLVQKTLKDAAEGKAVDLSYLPLAAQSTILYEMQNMEESQKKQMVAFLSVAGKMLTTAMLGGV
ncbi:MAG: hypothetical protein EBZ75_15005 [Oxalobacteraceae bacterium]|jgi:hypothetical protein|nr:hypothetical protein [Oxalobacteraceae bacterium]